MRRRLLALSLVSLMLFGAAACGNDGKATSSNGSTVSMGSDIAGLEVSGPVDAEPKVTVSKPISVDKPQTQVVTLGKGDPVQAGQQALLNIYLANGKDGKKAAATWDDGVPLDVPAMNDSSLFKPVVDALVGKPQGTRVAIAAPVKDVWEQGNSQLNLKPEDTAVFVVDVVSVPAKTVLKGPEGEKVAPPADAPQVQESNGKVTGIDFSKAPKKPSDKLQVITLVKGNGPVTRKPSLVTFNYFGEVYGASKPFDESYSKAPVTFALGMNRLIQGWDKGLIGLPRGSRVLLVVPPAQGYGAQSQANIPANSTLVFVVDILGVDG